MMNEVRGPEHTVFSQNLLCMFAPLRERSLLLARIRLPLLWALSRRWLDHLVRKSVWDIDPKEAT